MWGGAGFQRVPQVLRMGCHAQEYPRTLPTNTRAKKINTWSVVGACIGADTLKSETLRTEIHLPPELDHDVYVKLSLLVLLERCAPEL